jgi:hypothetical protein
VPEWEDETEAADEESDETPREGTRKMDGGLDIEEAVMASAGAGSAQAKVASAAAAEPAPTRRGIRSRVLRMIDVFVKTISPHEDTADESSSIANYGKNSEEVSEKTSLNQLRLDAAVPDQVYLDRAFEVAVSVCFLSSPKLTVGDLNHVKSGDVQVSWPKEIPYIQLRVCISAPECDVYEKASQSFRLYRGIDSPIFYFELTPRKLGAISIIVRVYQEDNSLGSARIRTNVREEEVGRVRMTVNSRTFQVPPGTQVFFGDYVAGNKATGVDQRGQQASGTQTNIDGGVGGPVASGNFESATAFGEGDAKDCREQEGD